jgi:hypothetical protein
MIHNIVLTLWHYVPMAHSFDTDNRQQHVCAYNNTCNRSYSSSAVRAHHQKSSVLTVHFFVKSEFVSVLVHYSSPRTKGEQ